MYIMLCNNQVLATVFKQPIEQLFCQEDYQSTPFFKTASMYVISTAWFRWPEGTG